MNPSNQSSNFGTLFWTLTALTAPASGLLLPRPIAQPRLWTGARNAAVAQDDALADSEADTMIRKLGGAEGAKNDGCAGGRSPQHA